MSTKRLNIDILARDKTGQAFKSVQQETKKTTQTLATLKTVLFAVVGSQAIRQILELGNTFQNLQNRLKLVTNSTSELISVQEELFKISQRTRGGFEETVTLYSKLALNSKSLGLQTSQLSEITENINKVIAIAGVNSIQASAGILQLSQAFASGRLQGDEFRSISENIPPFLDIFAKEKNVTLCIETGGLTTEQLDNLMDKNINITLDTPHLILDLMKEGYNNAEANQFVYDFFLRNKDKIPTIHMSQTEQGVDAHKNIKESVQYSDDS